MPRPVHLAAILLLSIGESDGRRTTRMHLTVDKSALAGCRPGTGAQLGQPSFASSRAALCSSTVSWRRLRAPTRRSCDDG